MIAGLGNPGEEFEDTRHNIGFMLVDEIARSHDFPPFKQKFSGLFSKKEIDGTDIHLFKPMTYMNLSGIAVSQYKKFYKTKTENITVVHDDLDMQLGRIRHKKNGGDGGHNGLKSIDMHIGKDYNRLKVGIGRPDRESDTEISKYVVSKFRKDEMDVVERSIDILIKNIHFVFDLDFAKVIAECSVK